jgi:hypothetical protein
MGAALYLALEPSDPPIGASVDGKALSRAEGDLATLANQLRIRPLMDFFSMSTEEFAAEAEEFNTLAGIPDGRPPEGEWFAARDGLTTVRALLAHLRGHPEAVQFHADVISDLESFEVVLQEADHRNVRWHLCVDY